MQIHTFSKVIEEIGSRHRSVSPIKYHSNYCILDVLYIFVYSMFFRIPGRRMVDSFEYNRLYFVKT